MSPPRHARSFIASWEHIAVYLQTQSTTDDAVITEDVGCFPNNLPIFSRLNMVQFVRWLRNTLGVHVEIAGIEQL